jgi:hypothetical protein
VEGAITEEKEEGGHFMSWVAVLMRLPPEVNIADLPADYELQPLGSKVEVLSLLAELFPDADFSDPTRVSVEREDFVIEFMVGDNDPVVTLGFRPHGDVTVLVVLRTLCERTGWRAWAARVAGPSLDPKGVKIGGQSAAQPFRKKA